MWWVNWWCGWGGQVTGAVAPVHGAAAVPARTPSEELEARMREDVVWNLHHFRPSEYVGVRGCVVRIEALDVHRAICREHRLGVVWVYGYDGSANTTVATSSEMVDQVMWRVAMDTAAASGSPSARARMSFSLPLPSQTPPSPRARRARQASSMCARPLLRKRWVPPTWGRGRPWRVCPDAPMLFPTRVVACSNALERCLVYDAAHPDSWVHSEWTLWNARTGLPVRGASVRGSGRSSSEEASVTCEDASSAGWLDEGDADATCVLAEAGILPLVHNVAWRTLVQSRCFLYAVHEQLHDVNCVLYVLVDVDATGLPWITAMSDDRAALCAYKYFGAVAT